MRNLLIVLALLVVAGCSSGSGNSGITTSQALSPFVGRWAGTWTDDTNATLGTASVSVDANYNYTGALIQNGGTTAETFSGQILYSANTNPPYVYTTFTPVPALPADTGNSFQPYAGNTTLNATITIYTLSTKQTQGHLKLYMARQ